VIVHGISVTPLMGHYDRRQQRDRATPGRGPAAPAEDSASERGGPGDSA
jgi:hypothetical protein